MKIAIIGAAGKAGSKIVTEAINRDHEVTAIVRDASKVEQSAITILEKDLFNLKAEDVTGFDAVVNAFNAPVGEEHLYVKATKALIDLLKGNQQTRLLVVGGAGSLFVDEAHTIQVMDTPDFPKEYAATAYQMGLALKELKNSTDVQWTFLSPAGFFDPIGNRTGTYEKGLDRLILNSKGESYISYADYAIAMVDEIEQPQHLNQRFTVISEAQ
ncbi:NAD(P)-dependent oxidoreductase [Cytobacillus spongiae]|uniref:NAD(P)-dependent oxidoreductase n=1 Tax=Cytobacillus spongiae TaxID=2901381 RepID=UPI001F239D4E|nr:NAD(P)H-binding protein [Cytobacillus spongiae]UII57562.1 NAD(P)-dependent oxidoreductase [Cytobacillus spongiae]